MLCQLVEMLYSMYPKYCKICGIDNWIIWDANKYNIKKTVCWVNLSRTWKNPFWYGQCFLFIIFDMDVITHKNDTFKNAIILLGLLFWGLNNITSLPNHITSLLNYIMSLQNKTTTVLNQIKSLKLQHFSWFFKVFLFFLLTLKFMLLICFLTACIWW